MREISISSYERFKELVNARREIWIEARVEDRLYGLQEEFNNAHNRGEEK